MVHLLSSSRFVSVLSASASLLSVPLYAVAALCRPCQAPDWGTVLWSSILSSIQMETDRWIEQNTEDIEYMKKKDTGAGGIIDRGAGDCLVT